MISGDSYENGQKKNGNKNKSTQEKKIGLNSKTNDNFARTRAAQFLCNIFAVVLHDYNVKLPKTS